MTSKRIFDVVCAALGLVISSPIWVIAAVATKLSSPGPVLHRAQRVGMDGAPFTLLKFRTMRRDAATQGPAVTTSGDPRITAVGRWLRRTKIDELPQLWNVLRGEMSLVGPRPEDPRYVALYTPRQRDVLTVRPGITSPASVAYRHEESLLVGADAEDRYVSEVMPAKLEIELEYIASRTLLADVKVLLRTAAAVLRLR